MRYIPKVIAKNVKENHKYFRKRILLYKKRGLDFTKSLRSVLKKAKSLRGSILEIGTGTGHTTLALAKAGYKFTSIDKDKEVLKVAVLNLAYIDLIPSVEFHVMDGKKLKFKDGSFNNIIAISLFHHIDNVDKMLAEIDRVLCANGKIVFADFNRRGMAIVDNVHKQEGRVHERSDATKESIYSYFHSLGYNITYSNCRNHWILIGKKVIKK
jgi:ubiquinone/menaquinone biosynthesis C-methylase UbiE